MTEDEIRDLAGAVMAQGFLLEQILALELRMMQPAERDEWFQVIRQKARAPCRTQGLSDVLAELHADVLVRSAAFVDLMLERAKLVADE